MVQPSVGLDTPRTNIGDATYLTNQPDFDISQEQSFQSPSKDNDNLIQQLQNGRRGGISLKTPRSRVPLSDRQNLPNTFGGGEFTPLLKSATRNSALRFGKENGVPRTPAFLRLGGLDNIEEDISPVPHMGSGLYGDDTHFGSYINGTPIPQIESSSAASTPMALLPRRTEGINVLQDGNQLSLREQENVIDKIEKENFGLKLKIHFLEDALRRAGPGFSEAALKENTKLKVDKVTMQKELHRYRKTLTAAERDLEMYRQQIVEMQEKARKKHADEGAKEELERLRQALESKEVEIRDLLSKIEDLEKDDGQFEKLHDQIANLEADIREKDRAIEDHDDEIESLRSTLRERDDEISDLEEAAKVVKRREVELEEKFNSAEDLEEARETIADLESTLDRLRDEVKEAKEERQEAVAEKDRACADLEELQEEMSNKSLTTKGLSRQLEEKSKRLQIEVDELRQKHAVLGEQHTAATDNYKQLSVLLHSAQEELNRKSDEKDLLQIRHDSLTAESSGLQKELAEARAIVEDLQDKLDHEKTEALRSERAVRDEYKSEIDRLNDEIDDLRAEVREKERLYDDDNDKWETERRKIESHRERAEEEAASLKRMVDRFQETEGVPSSNEKRLQEMLSSEKERHTRDQALLSRQIEEFNKDIESRRGMLEDTRSQLLIVEEELRASQREAKSLSQKVESLEDEIEVLQTTFDEETERAKSDLNAAKEESKSLRLELEILAQDQALLNSGAVQEHRDSLTASLKLIEAQLSRAQKEKQELQDDLAKVNIDMHSLKNISADLEAELYEARSQLRDLKQQDEDTVLLDQEKIELRKSQMKLDAEVRRLRDEAKNVAGQRYTTEMELRDEIQRISAAQSRLLDNESELLQREAAQKDILHGLRRQINELERRAHSAEILRLQATSPRSSPDGSAQKPEIIEVRHQLATAHQTLKDLRTKLKETERSASRKVGAATLDLQSKISAWEGEKDKLEQDLEAAITAKSDLLNQIAAAEHTNGRLKTKIERLERELRDERQNFTEDRTMALERRDLHSMLRETQIQASELELVVKSRNSALTRLTATESDLRVQLQRIRDERSAEHERAYRVASELEQLEKSFQRAKQTWEDERRALSRGVRFPNTSISELRGNETMIRESEEREKRHVKELRGLAMQIEWLRARCKREESLRADAAYAKRFMLLQVELFGACNAADLQMLQQMGITPDRTRPEKKRSLRTVVLMVMAGVRMKRGADKWAKNRKVHERLVASLEVMKRKTSKGSALC